MENNLYLLKILYIIYTLYILNLYIIYIVSIINIVFFNVLYYLLYIYILYCVCYILYYIFYILYVLKISFFKIINYIFCEILFIYIIYALCYILFYLLYVLKYLLFITYYFYIYTYTVSNYCTFLRYGFWLTSTQCAIYLYMYLCMYMHTLHVMLLCCAFVNIILLYNIQVKPSPAVALFFSISIIVHSGTGWWSLMTVRYFGGSNYRPVSNNRYQMSLIKLCIDLRIPGTIKAKMLVTRYSSNLLRMWIHSFRLETLTTQIFCSILVLSTYIHIYI